MRKSVPGSMGAHVLILLIALAACLFAAASAGAQDSPFGEPELLLDLSALAPSTSIQGPFEVDGAAVFLTHGEVGFGTPSYLWRTDGTEAGTVSIHPSPDVRFLGFLPSFGGPQWLTALDGTTGALEVWRTDGTAAGTRRMVTDVRTAGPFQYHPGLRRLFFSAAPWLPTDPDPGAADYEPWVSDGTVAGTRMLKDLVATGASRPGFFRTFGGEMAFLATDPAQTAVSLWLSDGTAAGTHLVKAPAGQSFINLQVVDEEIYLVGRKADQSLTLWHSDGTAAGTDELVELGARSSSGSSLGVVFSGGLGNGRSAWSIETEDVPASLWVSDGTPAGTEPLMPLELELPGASVGRFFPLGGRYYFRADDGTTGQELWRTDGTPAGTEVAFETCPGDCSDLGAVTGVLDGRLLLFASDPAHGMELRASDGTPAGTELLVDLCPGPCSSSPYAVHEVNGYGAFQASTPAEPIRQLWGTDFTSGGTHRITDFSDAVGFGQGVSPVEVGGRLLVTGRDGATAGLWAVALPSVPAPPAGDWLASPEVPGFSFKVRFSTPSGSLLGTGETECIEETLCVSGALPGRAEVFARVVGPKPNGFLWPTLVKFSTSQVEVWVRQDASGPTSGEVRYYVLDGARPGFDELPGLFDRTGFQPTGAAVLEGLLVAEPTVLAAGASVPPPAVGVVFTSEDFPDFRFRVRISAGDQAQEVRKEDDCIEETVCLSGAIPGRSEIFLRVVGPKPNGKLWPTIVKFTTSTVEVWVEQISTDTTKYYVIEGAAPGRDDLTGLFDRQGFEP